MINEYFILFYYTHTRLTALFPGLPGWAGTRKVKPIWILLKQETVSGSRISWAICKFALCSRQITTPATHHSVFFTGRMPFLPPNQQCQSTEGILLHTHTHIITWIYKSLSNHSSSLNMNGSIVNTHGSKYKDRRHILAYVGKRNTVESAYQWMPIIFNNFTY